MGGGEVAYFATTVTVIPVLFLVYTVTLKDAFKKLLDREREVEVTVGGAEKVDHPMRVLLVSFGLTLIRALLALVLLVPVAAELIGFISLSTEQPEAHAKAFVAVGLGVAALPISAPLFYAFALEPLLVEIGDTAKQVTGLRKTVAAKREKETNGEQPDAAVGVGSGAPREHAGEDEPRP
jgi:hypothetical protein